MTNWWYTHTYIYIYRWYTVKLMKLGITSYFTSFVGYGKWYWYSWWWWWPLPHRKQHVRTFIHIPKIGNITIYILFYGAEHKTKRLGLQCIFGVSSNSVSGEQINFSVTKSNSITVGLNFQTYLNIASAKQFAEKS